MESHLLTVNDNGQITIPIELATELGVGPGDQVAVERAGSSLFVRNHSQSVVDRVFGVGRPWAVIPPLEPGEERRQYEAAVAEENWLDLERQRLDAEYDAIHRATATTRDEG